jgi:hypothetical protein
MTQSAAIADAAASPQTEFQRMGLIEIKERSLAILDRAQLRHIAVPQ